MSNCIDINGRFILSKASYYKQAVRMDINNSLHELNKLIDYLHSHGYNKEPIIVCKKHDRKEILRTIYS